MESKNNTGIRIIGEDTRYYSGESIIIEKPVERKSTTRSSYRPKGRPKK
jgi:hypothetical protein